MPHAPCSPAHASCAVLPGEFRGPVRGQDGSSAACSRSNPSTGARRRSRTAARSRRRTCPLVGSYTRHYDPNGIFLDFAIWSGWGNGVGSAPIRRVTSVSEDPNVQFVGIGLESGDVLQGEFVGDYNGLAIGADFRVHPAWTDFRGRPGVNTPNQDLYTQSLSAF